MPAVAPLIMTGGSLLSGYLGSRKSKEEKAAMAAQQEQMKNLTGAGKQAMSFAKDQYSLASPAYGQAMNYYQRLLGGNRASQSLAVAAPYAATTDIYRGAERGLQSGTIRGGARDLAAAELNRDRAGQLARLTTGVQPMAAASLADLAGQGMSNSRGFLNAGVDAYGGGAKVADALADNARASAEQSNKAWGAAGKSIFDIWAPYLTKIGMKKPLPSSHPQLPQYPGAV